MTDTREQIWCNSGLLLLCLAVVLATGCREYHWYEYDVWEGVALGGDLYVSLGPSEERVYVKDGKRYAERKGNYFLSFNFRVPYEHQLAGILVKDIKMLGQESGRQIDLPDITSSQVRVYGNSPETRGAEHPIRKASAAAGPYQARALGGLPYESYIVTFTLVAYSSDSSSQEEMFSIPLKTDFKKTWSNDAFDAYMSI